MNVHHHVTYTTLRALFNGFSFERIMYRSLFLGPLNTYRGCIERVSIATKGADTHGEENYLRVVIAEARFLSCRFPVLIELEYGIKLGYATKVDSNPHMQWQAQHFLVHQQSLLQGAVETYDAYLRRINGVVDRLFVHRKCPRPLKFRFVEQKFKGWDNRGSYAAPNAVGGGDIAEWLAQKLGDIAEWLAQKLGDLNEVSGDA
ncbi:hypothetical protein EJ08DRAFT_730880, partial [Tothia fuscella]